MGQVLHGSATTTEAVRRAIQRSEESVRALARRHGISPTTVQKWRNRTHAADARMGPKAILTDNGIQLARLPKNRDGWTTRMRVHRFDQICREHGIEHRLCSATIRLRSASNRMRTDCRGATPMAGPFVAGKIYMRV